jgi:Ca2+-binding EF-hand superfamily protein
MFPTEAELSEMIKEADPQRKGVLEFSDFLSLVARRPPDADPEEELLEALEFFSENKEQQLIAVNQLRHHLTQQGERFSDAEMDDFLEFLNRSNLKMGNEVRYKDLAKLLINGYVG